MGITLEIIANAKLYKTPALGKNQVYKSTTELCHNEQIENRYEILFLEPKKGLKNLGSFSTHHNSLDSEPAAQSLDPPISKEWFYLLSFSS